MGGETEAFPPVVSGVSMPAHHSRRSARRFVAALIATTALCIAAPPGWAAEQAPPAAQKPARPAVRVSVASVTAREMPVVLDLVGNAQAVASIPVKTRVDSQIETVGVREGDRVAVGQVVFTLDDRAIKAQIAQQKAVVARDRAQLDLINSDLERTQQLVKTNTKSARDLESAKTQVAAQEATIAADVAQLENLVVQASYYVITSPIVGRVGSMPLKPGSAVRAADSTLLATINQIDPIHVAFAVPQISVAALRKAMAAGPVAVAVKHPGETKPAAVGRVAFIENTLDATTGTLGVKAIVDNPAEALLPGEYLQVRVTLAAEANALTVPEPAVQFGQYGAYVWAVGADDAAEIRRITVDRTVDGATVVTKGLAAGDRVVTEGQLRLAPGTSLEIAPGGATPGVQPATPAPKSGS